MGLSIRDLSISSPAFEPEGRIPPRCSKNGGNVQPEIQIRGVPDGAAELALICHDPDAPLPFGFTHWLLYGIPPETRVIGENAGNDYKPGQNDFGEPGYGGPRPPSGHGPHHYYFWVYALDTKVDGTPSRTELLRHYGDHILEQNRVVGIFSD